MDLSYFTPRPTTSSLIADDVSPYESSLKSPPPTVVESTYIGCGTTPTPACAPTPTPTPAPAPLCGLGTTPAGKPGPDVSPGTEYTGYQGYSMGNSVAGLIVWFLVIFVVVILALYALKPTFINKKHCHEVDNGKAILSACAIALFIVLLIFVVAMLAGARSG